MDDEVNSGSASSPGESSRTTAAFGLPPLGAQKVEVAAVHEVQAIADETDDLAAQAIDAPRCTLRNPVAEQDLGDTTVIRTVQRAVQGAQGEPKTAASIGRESRWCGSALHQQTIDPPRRVDPIVEQPVERKYERDRTRCRFTQQERASVRRQRQ